MNLFDKAILNQRLKKNKNEQIDLSTNLNSKSKVSLTNRKNSAKTNVYHTAKQFYI